MTRSIADCVLLDGVVTGGPTEVAPANLKGLRLGVPRGCFWEKLDAETGEILAAALGRLREAGVVLLEGDIADVHALDAAAGFPILLYEVVGGINRYLVEHETGLDFASLLTQVKSPAVRKALAGLVGADAVSKAVYEEALGKHLPALQDAYRRYFRERGVAAVVFPTTPLPAAKIGADDTIMLNGQPVPTFGTFIRNLCPGSAAGIPGLTLPAGLTKAGLPVGLALDGPESSDLRLLAIGIALETELPRLPAPLVG
jgi:mandelamide amidase